MNDARMLQIVRTVHTAIYIVMALSTFVVFYSGVTGHNGLWLQIAIALLIVETIVFAGNGMKCPLTAIAVRYGATSGQVFDTFLPERATRYTFRFFGTLMVTGFVLLALRWAQVLV